jgi:Short repeat of unknown function (DUF308)
LGSSARGVPGFLWTFVTALLSIVVGGLLLWKPIEGVLSLTIVLTAFFIVEGIFQAAAALVYRDGMPGSWGWLLVSGLADLALAAIIIMGWPGTAVWILGLLVGINLLTSGWAVVMVALGARETRNKRQQRLLRRAEMLKLAAGHGGRPLLHLHGWFARSCADSEDIDPPASPYAIMRRARPIAERTMDPARIFTESLTPRRN